MTLIGYLAVGIAGLCGATASFLRTPEADRLRAYPRDAKRWAGLSRAPAPMASAFASLLFYCTGAAAFGTAATICLVTMPHRPLASLAVAGLAGLVAATSVAKHLLRRGRGAMRAVPRTSKTPLGARPRVLFICGSPNQTTQMHQIARALPEVDAWYTPYYSSHWTIRLLLKLGLVESTIMGLRRRGICLDYLNAHDLPVDLCAERNTYDFFLTCNDQVIPPNLRGKPWILVQEGIQEPPSWRTWLWRRMRFLPAPLAGTATFGLSGGYRRFCVASEGYRRRYMAEGIAADKLVVTGIPNFDDFAKFRRLPFPLHGYVLVCTSDARETWLAADRAALLEKALAIAAGRPLVFKLHPNENVARATREIRAAAPGALVFADGSAEVMVAHCDVLVTEWSSLTFCGVALGKEVHSLHPLTDVGELLPLQNGRAAEEIAAVVRASLLDGRPLPARAGAVSFPGDIHESVRSA